MGCRISLLILQRIRLSSCYFQTMHLLSIRYETLVFVWVSLCLYYARSILLFACVTSSIKMILFQHWLLFFARWSRDVVIHSEEARDPQANGAAAGSHQRWWLWNLRVSWTMFLAIRLLPEFHFVFVFCYYSGKYATRMWHRLNRKLLAISWKGSSSTNSFSTTVSILNYHLWLLNDLILKMMPSLFIFQF